MWSSINFYYIKKAKTCAFIFIVMTDQHFLLCLRLNHCSGGVRPTSLNWESSLISPINKDISCAIWCMTHSAEFRKLRTWLSQFPPGPPHECAPFYIIYTRVCQCVMQGCHACSPACQRVWSDTLDDSARWESCRKVFNNLIFLIK